ncbi:MAG: hypothetical protein H5U40_13940, partial [Polyangiaceae bacterium]|nr:hypothetical protein [Polyangiaceae bacterium]
MLSPLNTTRATHAYFVGSWERVLIEIFFEGADMNGLSARVEAHRELSERYPGRVLSLTVVRQGSRIPESEIRAEASRIVKQLAPKTQ